MLDVGKPAVARNIPGLVALPIGLDDVAQRKTHPSAGRCCVDDVASARRRLGRRRSEAVGFDDDTVADRAWFMRNQPVRAVRDKLDPMAERCRDVAACGLGTRHIDRLAGDGSNPDLVRSAIVEDTDGESAADSNCVGQRDRERPAAGIGLDQLAGVSGNKGAVRCL